MINTYDIDGVIYLGKDITGVYPGPDDIIVTGRSYEESEYTLEMLQSRGILNRVVFNPLPFNEKSRETSGKHKGLVIKNLIEQGHEHGVHFEDDPVQIQEIRRIVPEVRIVHLVSNLVELENKWHGTEK
jgi:hypothetical protein